MKFGIRKPSLRKSFAARTSTRRMVKNSLGLRASPGFGWLTKPKKALYNRIYYRTTFALFSGLFSSLGVPGVLFLVIVFIVFIATR